MNPSIRLGRIFGIPVGLNWSVLVIAALIAVVFGAGQLPQVEGYSRATYLLAGLTAAVLFLGSILAHELAHALVARAKGVAVDGITLWLLGGVAKFTGEATRPRDEAVIALVGPLVSLTAGLAFGVTALVVIALTGEMVTLATAVLGWLAAINAVVAVFNLLPAAPLDGGRVLRAVLWARRGSRRDATLAAARAGRGLGIGVIGVGLLVFAAYGVVDGVWLMLLGWFLVTAAGAEALHARLEGVTVAEVMTRAPVVAPDWVTVRELIDQYVMAHRCSTFPLRAFSGHISGLVTMAGVKRVPAGEQDETRAREVAVPIAKVPVAHPDEPVSDLMVRLGGAAGGRALVFDGDELVGIVTPADLAGAQRRHELADARRQDRDQPATKPPEIDPR